MPAAFEREVKLEFASPAAARDAVRACGAAPKRNRRLQHDALVDTADGWLRDRRSVLRVRREEGRTVLTFKGPVQPSAMKVREEIETEVSDGDALLELLGRLGFLVWFRYEKYREEFALGSLVIAIDETPIGTYVEVEGDEAGIERATRALGRTPADFVLDSYRGLFLRSCEARGVEATDMVFAPGHEER